MNKNPFYLFVIYCAF